MPTYNWGSLLHQMRLDENQRESARTNRVNKKIKRNQTKALKNKNQKQFHTIDKRRKSFSKTPKHFLERAKNTRGILITPTYSQGQTSK